MYSVPAVATKLHLKDFFKAILSKQSISLEKKICNYLGGGSCFLTSNGSTALYLSLMATSKLSNKKKVIIPAYTCPTVALSVLKANLIPVLVDLSTDTYMMDLKSIKQDNDILAVVIVYLFGISPKTLSLESLRKKNIFIIEDCAQAFGAKIGNRKVGTLGDLSVLSFARGKNITSCEGGAIITLNQKLLPFVHDEWSKIDKVTLRQDVLLVIKFLAVFLLLRPSVWGMVKKLPFGFEKQDYNDDFLQQRMPHFAKLFLGVILDKLDEINDARRTKGHFLKRNLKNINDIKIPENENTKGSVYLRWPILFNNVQDKEYIEKEMQKRGIFTSKIYHRSLPQYSYMKKFCLNENFPNALYISKSILALPTNEFLTQREMEMMVCLLKRAIN